MRVVPLNYVMVKEAGLVDPLLINKWPNDGKSRIINYESRGAAKFNLKDYIGAVKDFENEIHDMEIFIKEFSFYPSKLKSPIITANALYSNSLKL